MKETSQKENLVRVTAWIPHKKLKALMKEMGRKYSQSQVLRMLVDNELERHCAWRAHEEIHGIARAKDFDDRLL